MSEVTVSDTMVIPTACFGKGALNPPKLAVGIKPGQVECTFLFTEYGRDEPGLSAHRYVALTPTRIRSANVWLKA